MYCVFIFTKGCFLEHRIVSLIVPEWQELLGAHEYRSFTMNPEDINDMFYQHLAQYQNRGFSNVMLIFDRNAEPEREVYIFPLHSRDIRKYQHNFEPRGHIINIQEYLQEIETYNNAPELLEKLDQYSCKP